MGNCSLRRSENSRIFLCHLIYTLRRRFGRHDLSGILGAAQIELVERLTAMISGKQVAFLVPHLAILEEVALPLRKHLAFAVLSCKRAPLVVFLRIARIILTRLLRTFFARLHRRSYYLRLCHFERALLETRL